MSNSRRRSSIVQPDTIRSSRPILNSSSRNSISRVHRSGSSGHKSIKNFHCDIVTAIAEDRPVTVQATEVDSNTEKTITYSNCKVVGNGSFGVVYSAILQHNNVDCAVKKVLQDKRFKNRELQILRSVNHPNIVKLYYYYFSEGDKKDDVYLYLIQEFVPHTLYKVVKHYSRNKNFLHFTYIKVYMYQALRAVGYIHNQGVCHRDIKPQNLLVNPDTAVLKLCDFGSAKMLVPTEPNVCYICSRYYRAPELIFGATNYTNQIDVWSLGCVLGEMILGAALFPGESGVDQLVEIIKVLGTPTKQQIMQMNPGYTEFKFPQIKACSWSKVFKNRANKEACDFLTRLLVYNPQERPTADEACNDEFFREILADDAKLPSGKPVPYLVGPSLANPPSSSSH